MRCTSISVMGEAGGVFPRAFGWTGIANPGNSLKAIDALTQLAKQIVAADKRQTLLDEGITLSASVADVIRSVLEMAGDDLGNEIGRCFGIGKTSALIRKGNRGGTRIILRKCLSNEAEPAEHELTIGAQGTEFRATIPGGTSMRINVEGAPILASMGSRNEISG